MIEAGQRLIGVMLAIGGFFFFIVGVSTGAGKGFFAAASATILAGLGLFLAGTRTEDGTRSASVSCIAGHAATLTDHEIASDGTVTPSVALLAALEQARKSLADIEGEGE